MSNSKYIKVTDANKKSSVVMATNEAFYKSQGYQISEPTQEEIEEYFPSARVVTASVQKVDTSGVETELQQVRTDLNEEKAEHLTTKNLLDKEKEDHAETANKLKVEQGHHADTKQALDAAKDELQQVRTDLESAQKELDKLKKKA